MHLLLNALCLGTLLFVAHADPQLIAQPELPPRPETGVKLPNGKNQTDEIRKAEYKTTLQEAAQLAELSESLKKELESNDSLVLSLATIKKTEEIEKLAKKIRSRIKH